MLLALSNAAGAQRVLAAGRGAGREPPRLSACAGTGGAGAGPDRKQAERIFKQLLLGHPLTRRRRLRAPS